MSKDEPQPDLPIPPGNGNGNGDPPPRPLRITSVSPIGGALAGGIDVTITGSGFEPDTEVFFGSNQSPEVTFVSFSRLDAKSPPATQTGSVDVKVVNSDGRFATKAGAFTYVTTEASLHAEILGIEPLTVIEDTESDITIRGRNLVAAYNEGIVALRGSTRVQITFSNSSSSSDPETGIESLILTVRITATPPLEQHERKAIQVLASLRPGAATDGIFETSRQMFTVLPRAVPVLLAFTGSVDPSKPNLVMVAGRNLEGCSLDMGEGVNLHMQKGDDQTVAAIISFPENAPVPESAQLRVLDSAGSEAGQMAMMVAVAPSVESGAEKSSAGDSSMSAPGDGGGETGPLALTMTPFAGQQILGPTATDSAVFPARGESLSLFSFDFGPFYVRIIERTFHIRLFDEVRLIPFFDNGVGDALSNTPVLAQVGKLFRLRGMGLLVALHVELIIHVEIVLIIGFRFQISPFGLFNEFFSDYPFAIGSLVISIRFAILVDIDFIVAFVVALVLPSGSLKVLFSYNLRLNIDFSVDSNGHFHFLTRFKHKVHFLHLGPIANIPLPCEGRFQLAEDQGQSVFTDSFGGQVSFYMPREAGPCCIPWDFGLELIRFEDGGPEQITQGRFRAEFCVNALANNNVGKVLIVSTQRPDGAPPPQQMNIADTDTLTALGQPVDDAGHPKPNEPLIDLSETGLVEFYLVFPTNSVLDRDLLTPGEALAIDAGENVIAAKVTTSRVVDLPPGEEPPEFSFWPGGVLGFDILSFLARGLPPAVKAGDLPVIVSAPVAGELTISLMVAYQDNSNPPKFVPTSILERNEPFELIQRDYVLQARFVLGSGVTQEQTLTFNVDEVLMAAPLAGLGFGRNRSSDDPKLFFTGALAQKDSHVAVDLRGKDLSKPIVVAGLTIKPNHVEVGTITKATDPLTKLVPPGRAVNNADAKVTVKLSVTSDDANTTVRIAQKLPDLTVSNNETFEEYLRVFKEVEKILADAGTKFSGFAKKLYDDVTAHGHGSDVIQPQGTQLWKDAYERVQGVGGVAAVKDDRPLYWARLQGIGALRAYGKRKTPAVTAAALEQAINQFEWTSRGMDLNGRIVFDGVPAATRKVVVTGFDPFELPSQPNTSNPSGLIALQFHKQSAGSSTPAVHIRTAIFPVRYKEFDAGWVEKAFEISLDTLVMLMTTSMNGSRDFYDVERWAGKNRRRGDTDNNNMEATGTPVTVGSPPRSTNYLDPGGAVAGGDEFLHSTLPYKLVITSAQTLKGPHRDQTPFVIDQSYKVIDTTQTTFKAGEFRPEPNAGDTAAFQEQPDSPDSSKKANLGSGGNYLSNEIFYRTTLRREDRRKSLASGHFHIPGTDTTPETTGLKLIEGVTKALGDFVDQLAQLQPRITNFNPRAGRPGDSFTIAGEHFDGAGAVLIGTTNLDTFNVDDPTQITAEVNDTARTGRITVTTPYGTAVSADVFGVIRRSPRGDLSAQLVERRAELGLSAAEAATQVGARLGTYRRWERGQDRPSARFVPAITTFLGHDPNPDPVAFGESIRAARERDGLTRSQLAQRLGLASSTVKAWEDGAVHRPTPRVASIFEEYVVEE